MAKVIAINISEKKKTPKKSIHAGTLIENFGFEGDAHAGKWHRQVSLLAKESIEKAQGMRTDGLCHGMFAENMNPSADFSSPPAQKCPSGSSTVTSVPAEFLYLSVLKL